MPSEEECLRFDKETALFLYDPKRKFLFGEINVLEVSPQRLVLREDSEHHLMPVSDADLGEVDAQLTQKVREHLQRGVRFDCGPESLLESRLFRLVCEEPGHRILASSIK